MFPSPEAAESSHPSAYEPPFESSYEPSLEVLPAAGRATTAWRNGTGVTAEIARSATDPATADFDWRISVAEVVADGPFSEFPGVSRTIVLVEGAAMTLTIDGADHVLGLYQPLTFDGGSRTFCTLPDGPTRDLNLMTTVGRAAGTVEVIRLDDRQPTPVPVPGGAPLVLLALAGHVLATPPTGGSSPLDVLDAVRWPSRQPIALSGTGVVAVLRITAP